MSNWNVANGKSFHCMFKNTTFNGDLSKWDVSQGQHFGWMFEQSEFNGTIDGWSMAQARDVTAMFAKSAFEHDVGSWAIAPSTKLLHLFEGNADGMAAQTPTAWIARAFVQEHALDPDVDWMPALTEYHRLRGALGVVQRGHEGRCAGHPRPNVHPRGFVPIDERCSRRSLSVHQIEKIAFLTTLHKMTIWYR